MASNWSKTYWADLGERVASTAIGAVITMLTADSSGVVSGSAKQWWLIVGLPTVLSFLKGILANLKDSDSGPSLLPSPPAPDVNDEAGAVGLLGVVVIVLVVLAVLALFGVF